MAAGAYNGADMAGAVFTRTSCLMSLIHAKSLLLVHGYESFAEYIVNYFDTNKKGAKNQKFISQMKNTAQYQEFETYLEESRATSNHPKLKKLSEILVAFFMDPAHAENSKVIVFSQYR